MKLQPLLIFLLIVIGIYLLPTVLARFAGTHTIERNQTAAGGPEGLDCTTCHSYIYSELNNAYGSAVTQKHRDAVGISNYTIGWLQRNLSQVNQTDYGVCLLCHALIKDYESYSHTGVTVRVCTDINCHGTNTTTNNTFYPSGNVGTLLGGANAHEGMMDGLAHFYHQHHTNETGSNYTNEYYTCLICHTPVEVDINSSKISYNHSDTSWANKRYI